MTDTPPVNPPPDQPPAAASVTRPTAWHRVRKWTGPLLTLIVFVAALHLLGRELRTLSWAEVEASFQSIPRSALALAVLLTAANYLVLIGYDWLGVHLVRHPIAFRQVVKGALLSYAFGNSLGVLLGGTLVRVRLYSAWGLTPPQIVRLIFFIGFAYWIGLCTLGGILFIATPFDIPVRFGLPLATSRPLGVLLLSVAAAFFVACAWRRRPLPVFGVNFQPPTLRIGVAQAAVASFDFILAAGAMFVLIPPAERIAFLPFVAIFLLAILVALISNVPGGVGVLELVLVTTLPQSSSVLVASLLTFRIIYFMIPLLLAVCAVMVMGIRRHFRLAEEPVPSATHPPARPPA